jgi:hypothetical protein
VEENEDVRSLVAGVAVYRAECRAFSGYEKPGQERSDWKQFIGEDNLPRDLNEAASGV